MMFGYPFVISLSAAAVLAVGSACGATTSTYDFSTGNGGFSGAVVTGSVEAAWAYSAGGWSTAGSQNAVSVVTLSSPVFVVDAAGPVSGSLTHEFSFDTSGGGPPPSGLIYYDGGLIEYRVNGGSWSAVSDSLVTGVAYGGELTPGWGNPKEGSPGFVYTSNGLATSNFSLGTSAAAQVFTAGDLVEVRFLAAFDPSSSPVPAWQIHDVTLTTAVPESSAMVLGAVGLAGLLSARRRR